jgi:hypothetical protein
MSSFGKAGGLMGRTGSEQVLCPSCGAAGCVHVYRSVNVRLEPDLRDLVLSDELNLFRCAQCGMTTRVIVPVLYHDMRLGFAVWFMPNVSQAEYADAIVGMNATSDCLKHAPMTRTWYEFKDKIVAMERSLEAGLASPIAACVDRRFVWSGGQRLGLIGRLFGRSRV